MYQSTSINGGAEMRTNIDKMKIDINKMVKGTPEFEAEWLITHAEENLFNMDENEFESWLANSLPREEIVLGNSELVVSENEKKAILYFIAFLYYRNLHNHT